MTADLALVASDPGFLERSADPGEFIIQACERAKTWLREALENGEIDQIVEVKSQAEAVRVYTMQKQLGKDAQLSAAEIVRRAERGIGLAIRRGQEKGTIRRRGQGHGYTQQLPGPADFASHDELMGNQAGIYDLTDGVTNEDFEVAVTEARAEENLSRANVVRKVKAAADRNSPDWIPDSADHTTIAAVQRRKLIRQLAADGFTSRQIGSRLGTHDWTVRKIARECGITIGADETVRGTRRIDCARIARETVQTLEAIVMGIELVDFSDLDPAEAKEWAASLTTSIRSLNRFARQIRETAS